MSKKPPLFTVVMAVTEWSARSRASINASISLLENICKPGAFSGRLILFDKTLGGSAPLETIESSPQIKIDILHRPVNEGLFASIMSLARYLDDDSQSWVQVLAEDDVILSGQDFSFSPAQETVMFLPDMLFVGHRNLFESRGDLHGLADLDLLGAHEIGGDTSWHGIVRQDIMLQYCKWLASLRHVPFQISNILVFLALCYGKVERLTQFAYIKEASCYHKENYGLERHRHHLNSIFRDGDLVQHSGLLNVLAAISLILNNPSGPDPDRKRRVLSILDRKIEKICKPRQRQLDALFRFFGGGRHFQIAPRTAMSLASGIDLAETKLGKRGKAVVQNFHLR